VVIENDVGEPVAHQRLLVAVASAATVEKPVGPAGLSAQLATAAAGGDVAQLVDVGVQQIAGARCS
jgi:hypothetical protein